MGSLGDRRLFVLGGLMGVGLAVPGCAGLPDFAGSFETPRRDGDGPVRSPDYAQVYGRIEGEQFPIAAFDYTSMDPAFLRSNVPYRGPEPAGTVVVEPKRRWLYLVESGGRATRYGVGVGREGFGWSGIADVNMRRAWPDWVPPKEMVERDPAVWAQLQETPRGRGIPGGPKSPLGARALYLFADGRDTGYRIHGTTEPDTIGTDVSSGCVRMINQDVLHLYGRTAQGAKVLVLA